MNRQALTAELLECRTLLTGPGFVSVSPNIGEFLQDGDVRTETPEEFVFQFSPGQTINTSTLDAIQITAAGHDGEFRPASTITDFGTGGQVVLRLGTRLVGTDLNGSSLSIQNADNSGNGPTVSLQAATNEIQQIDIGAQITGGTFRLSFSGNTTAPIAFDASAATVRAELEALPSINPGDVITTGGALPLAPLGVEFAGQYARTNVPQMILISSTLTNNERQSVSLNGAPTGGTFTLSLTGPGITGTSNPIDFNALAQNERQFVSLTGAPTGGNFTLTFNDAGSGINGTSGNIAFNDNAAAVQAAIEAGIPALVGNIQVTGPALPGGPVAIEFIGTLAATNVASFMLGANNLTGGTTPTATIRTSESVKGALEAGIPGLAGNILVTGGPLPGTVTIEFNGARADTNINQFTVGSNNLTGGFAPAPAIQTISDGNQNANGVSTVQAASVNVITLTLDSNSGNPTTADSLLTFIQTDPVASTLLSGSVLEGDSSVDISGAAEFRTLSGAGAASVISDLGSGTDLRVQITADNAGLDGNLISVQINRLDLGAVSSTPQVSVTGNRIQIVLNENPARRTTAQQLVNALNANAGSLINASVALGAGATVATGIQDGTLLQLSGADRLLTPGLLARGNTSNEILYRFAEPLPDDDYRIEVIGTGMSPLTNAAGEAFKDGADEILEVSLNLGGQVTAVVPQPVLRDQVITVGNFAGVRDGDTITVDPGTSPDSFAVASDDFGTAGVAEITFEAAPAGSAGNGVTVIITKADQGMAGAPTVSVLRKTVTVALNSNATNESTAQDLIDAIAASPEASALVSAELTGTGTGGEDITTPAPASTTLTLSGAVDLFVFELNDTSVEAPGTVRGGNIAVDFNSTTDDANTLAGLIATAISNTTISDPDVTAAAAFNKVTVTGGAFDPRVKVTQQAAGLSVRAGGLTQRRDTVNVYFTQDELASNLVENPVFYRLFDTNETFTRDDANVQIPTSVVYDPANHTATLTFASDLADATYRLRLGETAEANNTDTTAVLVGTIFDVTEYVASAFIGDDLAQGLADVDLYEVTLQAGATINAGVVANGTLNAVVRLFSDAGAALAFGDDNGTGGNTDQLSFFSAMGGTFYIGVSSFDNTAYGIDGSGAVDGGTSGAYTLAITSDTGVFDTFVGATPDDNSSFDTATDVGILGTGLQRIGSQIEPQSIALPPPAGGSDEPGHREIPAETHGPGPGTTPTVPGPVGTVTYSFPVIYGADSQGNPLFNQITADQKTRAREIFEIYSDAFGFEVAEVTSGGIGVVTGDPRAVLPTVPVSAVGGIAGGGLVVMNSFVGGGFTAAESEFGAQWMGIALHEIGHAIGLLHSYDIRSDQGNGTSGEDQYPGNNDIVHGRRIHPNDANDIDVYGFEVEETGVFTAEIVAERLGTSSLLNSALKLYREDAMTGKRTLIAQNDDYFSNDSYIELTLDPGSYFIAVSSTGNTDYDPTVSDTGFNGTSDGVYDLKLGFVAAAQSSLSDMTGVAFDGDNDGEAGGNHEFHFRSANTIFVDKTVVTNLTGSINSTQTTINVRDNTVFNQTAPFDILIDNERMTVTALGMTGTSLTVMRAVGGTLAASHSAGKAVRPLTANGSESNPFGLISSAIAASSPGDIIRIVGNGGADNDILTIGDNRSYLVGLNDSSVPLEDGSKFEVPRNVVVQIDAGAIVKLDSAIIDAGTSAVGIDRSGGAIQVLGTPFSKAQFTSYKDDSIGGDSNGVGAPAQAEDWGGLVFRSDSDFQDPSSAFDDPGIFLNYVNQAAIRFGGGKAFVDSVEQTFSPIHIVSNRPTITNNMITNSADAAMSANPNAFDDSRGRIGPDIHGNILVDNTINGIFVRIETQFGKPIDRLSATARFDDTDIVHVITENLEIVGNPGGPLNGVARPSGRLAIDPGVVVKLGAARIEALRGNAHLIAEGTEENPVIFTSIQDDRYGAGGTFDTTNNMSSQSAAAGDWGGLIFNATTRGSIDHAYIGFGGGTTPIAGSIDSFNTIEVHHQADVRIASSTLESNDVGNGGSRNGRGSTAEATIFVRQAQPIIVNNTFRDNKGTIIHINANSLIAEFQRDTGRSTGTIGDFPQFADNRGPLVRLNPTENNDFNGMEVRGETLTTESVWDDTDIVHILRSEIIVDQHHTYSGLRLQSNPGESLVVKGKGANAGITADGIFLDIDDRIGGTVQVIGRPGFPVVMTSLDDCTVGAGLRPDGFPQLFTNNNCVPSVAAAPSVIDVVLLLDDTTSFENAGDTVVSLFPQIVTDLQAALPGGDFAFGIARFEEYAGGGGGGGGGAGNLRPYILNQPVLSTADPQFQAAIDAALLRDAPGTGTGADETHIEALFQVATGVGFDGNGDGDVSDSGPAGLFTTQTSPGAGGDVPDFASFMADLTGDPNGPILPGSGTIGGIGFRATATDRIVLIATDGDFIFEDDGLATYTGVGGVTVPRTDFATPQATAGGTPGGRGATIQNTIDALIAENIKVVGLGAAGGFGGGGANTVQLPLEALATLTGATDVNGNPLYFDVDPNNGPLIASSIVSAVTGSVQSLDASPGDWRGLVFRSASNDRNVRIELENEDANNGGVELNDNQANAQFLGELAPQHITGPTPANYNAIDTTFRLDGDDNRPLGFEIHGYISADDPGDVDVYSFKATAGSEVWFDLDQTRGAALDPVIELVQADGVVLARARYDRTTQSVDLDTNFGATGSADVLTKFAFNGGDFYSFNPYDTGFRAVLPGASGAIGTYFVRVRSNQATEADTDNPALRDQGLTTGEYKLQIRLRQVDEKPGSTVRFADIRFASDAIVIDGLPTHSPLLADALETTRDNGPGNTPQPLGNLLESDLNTLNVGGTLASSTDIDTYQFNVDYATTILAPSIQSIGGLNDGGKTWTTVFDVDYADGLTRGDTTLTVYDSNGIPILIGRESNIEDDQPAAGNANDLDDLLRGTVGELDPFIGPVQLPAGGPGSTTNYTTAISSNSQLNSQLNQTFNETPNNTRVRLEPVNSSTRIIEDHIGTQGYDSNGSPVAPVNQNSTNTTPGGGLFDITDEITLSANVRAFDLGDVPLFVTNGNTSGDLFNINALYGQQVDTIAAAANITDLAMRSDGVLYGYRDNGNPINGAVSELVTFDLLSAGNGAISVVGGPSIPVTTTPFNNTNFDDVTNVRPGDETVSAIAWRRTGIIQWELYYAVNESGNTKLYRANPANGSAAKTGTFGFKGDIQPAGVGFAEGSVTVSGERGTGTIRYQSREAGAVGNGIRININRSGGGGPAVSVAGKTITVRVDFDNTPGNDVTSILNAINGNAQASALVTVSLQSGTGAATLGQNDDTGPTFAGGTVASGGTGVPLNGNVTGLAADSFNNGQLYGVTSAGEFLRITPQNSNSTSQFNATTMVVRDFRALGILGATERFTGLTLGPQNLQGGIYKNTFFASTSAGRLLAFDTNGNGVIAFDSNGEVQRISITPGTPTAGTFTLTYDDGTQSYTTKPIVFNAPSFVSENETVELETVAYDGTFTLTFVDDNGHITSLRDGIDDTQTTFVVDDASGLGTPTVLNPTVIQIDGEQLHVTNVGAGNTLTVVRSTNGVVETHLSDATVSEVMTTTITSDLTMGTTTIDVVDGFILPSGPFEIRIGTEDIRVDMIVGNTLTLTRGINGTADQDHFAGDTVLQIDTTSGIAYDALATDVATALGALAGVGAANVTGTDGPLTGLGLTNGTPATLEFVSLLGGLDLDDLTYDTAGLEGDEIQSFTIPSAIDSGTFTLSFGANTTPNLPFNETPANIETALENLASIQALGGDVQVSGTLPGLIDVQFVGAAEDTNIITQLTINSNGLVNNERQFFLMNGGPTGGTFTVSFGGTESAAIAFDADAGAFLTGLNTIGALNGNVTISSGADLATGLTVEFVNGLADQNVNQIIRMTNSLTGGTTPDLGVSTVEQGNQSGSAFTSRQGQAVDVEINKLIDGITSVYDALVALPSLTPTEIQVNGGPLPGNPIDVTFLTGVDENLMTVRNDFMLNGSSATVMTIGVIGDGAADNSIISAGVAATTGLAFSPLDFNLWHPTNRRGAADEPGHGINATYDLSRGSTAGGTSFYFGLEEGAGGAAISYESTGQLGVLVGDYQRDLTSTNLIGNNYNLPAGAYGSLITDTFDLTSSTGSEDQDDRPTLYFNYFLDSEDQNTLDADGTMRDSARVFLSNDGGLTWNALATNNTPLAGGIPTGNDTTEIPHFQSHSALANLSDSRQLVQGLFDTGEWRQARVDLSAFTGQTGLKLRFDFSTAGTITDTGVTNNDPDLVTPVDSYGDLNDTRRGQNNQFEGFYIDDIIIGWSERGEMITAATANQTPFTVPQPPAALMLPQELLAGQYQLEIRRGFEYAAAVSAMDPEISVSNTFDTNSRFIPGSTLGLPNVSDDFDGDGMDPTTIGFDPTVGWIPNSAGSNATWTIGTTPIAPTTNLTNTITAGDNLILVDNATGFATNDLILVGTEPMVVLASPGGGVLVVARGPSATGHAAGTVVSHLNAVAQSGTINNSQQSVMQVTQTTSGVTFDYRVDADQGDFFRVYVDTLGGVTGAAFESGDTGGVTQTATISVTPGVHTFYFVYQKDGLDAAGNPLLKPNTSERVTIDNVVFSGLGSTFIRGDRNLARQQGHIQIENNIIRDVAGTAIDVSAAPRASGTNFASPGSPINFGTINADRLAPSVAIVNNVIANFGTAGIKFAGDPLSGGNATNPASAVPFGKIINNTIYGGTAPAGTGIIVQDNASPTILNNIFANTNTPITVDGTSGSTVVARSFFHNNANPGVQGQNFIDENNQATPTPLFVNPAANNFYLEDNAEAIDRSLRSLADRANFVSFKADLQIPNSDVFSPDRDLFGQKRVDDPTQLPSGLGGEVFNDLGAVERSDFIGGVTTLTVPQDNGPDDLDPLDTVVHVDQPELFTKIVVQFTDAGIGIDDSTVRSDGRQLTLTVQTRSGTRVFNANSEITDPFNPVLNEFYTFAYNSNTNEAILTSFTLFPQDARYTLTVDNSAATGIRDFAGNPLIANQTDGTVRFDILVTSGANDPPTNAVPGPQTMAENVVPAPTVLTFSSMDGNAIVVDDPDAFISTDELQVTLNATNGRVTLPSNFASLVTLNAGSGTSDTSVTFTGTITDLNTLFAGGTLTSQKLQFVPNLNFNGTAILQVVTNDLGNFSAPPITPMTDNDSIAITVTPVNSAPIATAPATDSVVEDMILTFGGNVSVSDVNDGNMGIVQTTLSVTNGTLTLSGTTGIDTAFSDASGTLDLDGSDGTLEFRGLVADINAALNGLQYAPNLNHNNSNSSPFTPDVLTVTIDDLGNTGAGAAISDTATVDITVVADNDEPDNELDGVEITGTPRIKALEWVMAEPAVIFDGLGPGDPNVAPGNPRLSVSDVDVDEATTDTGILLVTLAGTRGTFTLTQPLTGLTFIPVDPSNDGTDDATLTFRGLVVDINAALDGMAFNLDPGFTTAGFAGEFATITITTSDEGRTGPMGGVQMKTDVIEIDVLERNDNPVNTVPLVTQFVDEDPASPLTFSVGNSNLISVDDIDAGGAIIQISLTAPDGAIALNPAETGDLVMAFSDSEGTRDADGSDGTLVVRGTITDLNEALDGLTFTPNADFNGSTSLTITTNDLGNTGNGGPMTDTDSVAITVNTTNDNPAVELGPTMGNTLTVNATEDMDFTFSSAAANQIVISDRADDPTSSGSGVYDVSLSIAEAMPGALTLATSMNLDFDQAGGDSDGSDGSLRFQGTLADINTALNGLVYSPEPGVTDTSRTLDILVDDLGNIDADLTPALTGIGTVTIVIDGSNDPPVNTVPTAGPLTTTDEDVNLVFTSGVNGISIEDIDAGTADVQVTLTATNGTLTLNATGLDFGFTPDVNGSPAGDGTADATMRFRGQIGNINAALDGLFFRGNSNYNGPASLTITTNDLGNTGSGGPLSDTDTVAITVSAVNDAPVITGPAGLTVNEDSNVTISAANMNGVSIDDVDLGSGKFLVTLSVGNGTLTLRRTTGLTFTAGADGTSTMTFNGSRTAVNSALDGSIYRPNPGYSGSDTLSVSVGDQGNTGSGGPKSDARAIPITVRGVNDAPVLTLAKTSESVDEDLLLTFSTSNSNQISVADVDVLEGTGRVQVTLSAANGALTLSQTTNLDFSFTPDSNGSPAGDGISDANMTFRGPIADVNVALSGLVYRPNQDFNGSDTLNVSVSDLGNAGFMATPLTNSGAVMITVNAVNDAPVNAVPGAQSTPEDNDLSFSPGNSVPNGISISDVDAGPNPIDVLLTVTNGSLTLGTTSDLDFSQTGGDSNGSDGSLRFRGTIASINTALDGLTYSPTMDFAGTAILAITSSDLGATGSGGAKSDTDTVQIMVSAENDRPLATGDSYSVQQGQTLTVNDTVGLDGNPNNDSVILNDTDPDGDTIIAVLDAGPAFHSGVFSLNDNGTFTYQHDGTANFTDSFTYHVTDGSLDSTPPVTVTIAINAPPQVSGATFSIVENTLNGSSVGTVSASDANLDTLAYSITAGNTNSAFAINSSGQITVNNSAALNFEATPSFALVVQVSDGKGGTTNAAVDVNLNDLSEAVVISSSDFTNDGLTIIRSGSKVRVVNTVTGVDVTPAHELTKISSLTLTGRNSNDDTLTVDFSNGNPIPSTGMSYNGGTGGNDDLRLIGGSVGNVSHTFTNASSGTVNVDGSVITYTGLEPIADSLAAQTRTFTFGSTSDVVTVADIGTANDGRVSISSLSTSESVDFSVPAVSIEILLGSGNDQLTVTSLDGNFLGTFIVRGENGNDTINAGGLNSASSLFGGAGNDNITGGNGADYIFGDSGDDIMVGGNGNDTLFGAAGADTLTGGDGTNELHGQGTSFDVVRENVNGTILLTSSTPETAILTWGTGSNVLRKDEFIELTGSIGNEIFDLSGYDQGLRGVTVNAGDGNDVVIGTPKDDLIFGGNGNDNVDGGDGDDILDLGSGNDTGLGGNGSDQILGGDGDDDLQGGNQPDIITPGNSDMLDLVNGGGSNIDRVVLDLSGEVTFLGKIIPRNGTGNVLINRVETLLITGSSGNDRFDFSDYDGAVTLFAGAGDDTYIGTEKGDVVFGEDGNDVVDGRGGNDYVLAGAGNDAVRGGEGSDIFVGDLGDDTLLGGNGNDFLLGSRGSDLILGENGDDLIRGQGGADRLAGGGNGTTRSPGDIILSDSVDIIDDAFSFDFDALL